MSLCIITQKYVFLIPYNQENRKKLNNSKFKKRGSRFVTYITICRSWWQWHVLIPLEIYPRIGVFIYSNNLSSPPSKEVSRIWVGHPTTPQSTHSIYPMPLDRILNPVKRNVHSGDQSWNTLKEKRAQNTTEPKVPHSTCLTLTEIMFHVVQ